MSTARKAHTKEVPKQRYRSQSPLALSGLAVLWLAVVFSSLGVVSSTHEGRLRLNQLEILRREAAQLQVEWGQYLLEQSTWAAYSRIEQIAINKLQMQVPETQHIIMVDQ